MKGKNLPSPILRRFLCMLRTLFAIVALCDAACSDEMMKIKNFYTDSKMIALIKAAENRNLAKLKRLVDTGTDPNSFGKEGMTPLFLALGRQNKKAMKALLAVGADPNLKDPGGDSPMAMAAGAKDTELMKILLDGGGDPNIRNDVGEPALFAAIRQKSTENVKILLDHGADINATDRSSTRPVMYAAILNQYHIVHFLLEKGADHEHLADGNISLAAYVQDGKVNTQLEAHKWREKVIKLLKDRGVKFSVSHPSENQKPV